MAAVLINEVFAPDAGVVTALVNKKLNYNHVKGNSRLSRFNMRRELCGGQRVGGRSPGLFRLNYLWSFRSLLGSSFVAFRNRNHMQLVGVGGGTVQESKPNQAEQPN